MRRPVLAEDSVGPRATTVATRISIINKEQPSRCAHRTLRKTILMHYAENLIDIGACTNSLGWVDGSLQFGTRAFQSNRLKPLPNVKAWRLLGRVTRSKHRVNCVPNVKVWRLLGTVTCSRLLSKSLPNVKVWRFLDSFTGFRSWLNSSLNVMCSRVCGRCFKYSAFGAPAICVTPSNASSSWETGKTWIAHHAA